MRPVFTPGDYCRRHTGLAEKRVDKKDNNEDLNEQNKVKKRERERDIDEEDRTGEHDNAKNRESLDLTVETGTHVANSDSREGGPGTRRGTSRTGEPHTCDTRATRMGDNNAAGQQEMGKMKRTKEGDNKGRETIARRRESDVRESGQMRKIIGGILGEKGKDRMYEEKGAGAWKKGTRPTERGTRGETRGTRDTRTRGQGQTRGRRKGMSGHQQ